MKLWGQAGRGQGVTSLHFAYPFPRFTPHHIIPLSLPLPAPPASILRRELILRHGSEGPALQLSSLQLFRPFLPPS